MCSFITSHSRSLSNIFACGFIRKKNRINSHNSNACWNAHYLSRNEWKMILNAVATFSTELHYRNVAWRLNDVGDSLDTFPAIYLYNNSCLLLQIADALDYGLLFIYLHLFSLLFIFCLNQSKVLIAYTTISGVCLCE